MDQRKHLKVLFLTVEAAPFVKIGGLGDVAGALPGYLKNLKRTGDHEVEIDIRLVLPFHAVIRQKLTGLESTLAYNLITPRKKYNVEVYQTSLGDVPVYLIDGSPIPKDGPVYGENMQADAEKFVFFSLAALELARAVDWRPDILHANDWHTASAIYAHYVTKSHDPFYAATASLLAVHNLPFMGAGAGQAMLDFGLPESTDVRLPYWAKNFPLPMGMASADKIITVSPGYAAEILTPEYGCGLETFLTARKKDLTGILNGLDTHAWDPATDVSLTANFDMDHIDLRIANKRKLIEQFRLNPDPTLPLFTFIGRMDQQKGLDIALEALWQTTDLPWQAILLGTGDPALEERAAQFEARLPSRVRSVLRFDAKLARELYAGSDMVLIPSRYEPCGTVQMIAMRYGCVPLARATGGLVDTIQETGKPETSTGFLFQRADADDMEDCLRRALTFYENQTKWKILQKNCMAQDFSWERSAGEYAALYLNMTKPHKPV